MARPLRIEFPGAVYHITSRGNERRPIFLDNTDRKAFLTVFSSAVERFTWICHAYCPTENHYHILIETPEGNQSQKRSSATKPSLDELFTMENRNDKRSKDEAIVKASTHYGYTLQEIAEHLGVHYTTVSRALKRTEQVTREM